ncbi:hypothetical protein SLEP1_g6610 [Rubroshorea leprosula]|uniref:Uncharacterized protein n=1 Tax=Rubroshorea leprosula TaxID=152421 RepID=A0AAV5I3V4_9ROSI|nr:hypothetical protein SLEP1_g6610 [Rubroshorea leprosula]
MFSDLGSGASVYCSSSSPDPLQPDEPPATATHFRPGTPVKLGDFPFFLVLEHLFNPEFFQICSLPFAVSSLLLGANFWAFPLP